MWVTMLYSRKINCIGEITIKKIKINQLKKKKVNGHSKKELEIWYTITELSGEGNDMMLAEDKRGSSRFLGFAA